MAVVDFFLKIDGIPGESHDSKHKEEIQLDTYSWGETQAGSFQFDSGGGAGKVQMQDFQCVFKTCLASPKLMFACAAGTHIENAGDQLPQGRQRRRGLSSLRDEGCADLLLQHRGGFARPDSRWTRSRSTSRFCGSSIASRINAASSAVPSKAPGI